MRGIARAAGADDLLLVGDSLRVVDAGAVEALEPADGASRVAEAVDRAAALGRPLVLVTDGELDDPESLASAPPGSRLERLPPASGPDGALMTLQLPAQAAAGDTVRGDLTVGAGRGGAPAATVALWLDDTRVSMVELAPLAAGGATVLPVTVPLPRGTGTRVVRAVLTAAGDAEPRNDTLAAAVVVDERSPVVFVSTAPDLDVREALAVLRGALELPVRGYLRLAPGLWREEGSFRPVTEAEVRARATAAALLVVHGDTAWAPLRDGRRAARVLWRSAPPSPLPRAGELGRPVEWYPSEAPPSPVVAALAGVPWDSLPPLSLAGPAAGPLPVLLARVGRSGAPVAAIAAREDATGRTVVVSGSGYGGWALRGGRSAEAFTALWGAIFDWAARGGGDGRRARPAAAAVRAGEPITWLRGTADTLVTVVLARRPPSPGSARPAPDTLRLRFPAGTAEAVVPGIGAGIYDVRTDGGESVLVVNPSREWLPRPEASFASGAAVRVARAPAPRLGDLGWPIPVALLLLCAEWLLRRRAGLR